ncbi:MAG: hypothetical protein EOO46_00080 [Flavobacterium sp.]|nr:MAG: hypothetical protein EOO46_00080 [Flavobacterium sp.]
MKEDFEKILQQFLKLSDDTPETAEVESDALKFATKEALTGNFEKVIEEMRVAGIITKLTLPAHKGGATFYNLTPTGVRELKETYKIDFTAIPEFTRQLEKLYNILRGSVDTSNYHFFLYLLSLQRYNFLDSAINGSPREVKGNIFNAAQQFEENFGESGKQLNDFYSLIISRVDNRVLFDIIHLLNSVSQTFLKDHFTAIFEDLLDRYQRIQGRIGGEIMLPPELSRFVSRLANSTKGDHIYNPFGGLASFAVYLKDDVIYSGQEINQATWALGKLRLLAHDRNENFNFSIGNSIFNWNPAVSTSGSLLKKILKKTSPSKDNDLIISNPPFSGKLPGNIQGRFGAIKTYEQFLLEKGIENLSASGKLIGILSSGFLYRNVEENLRQYLVEHDLLDTIIAFPDGLLRSTAIPVVAIVINKNKLSKGFVKFVDAKNFILPNAGKDKRLDDKKLLNAIVGEQDSEFLRMIPIDKIRRFNYDLTVGRYFRKTYEGVTLGEIGITIPGQRTADKEIGKLVRIRELKDDPSDFELDISKIEDSEIPRQALRISESCILLATRWRTLKPTYFNFTGIPIFIRPDTIALKIDTSRCDESYLIYELHSKDVADQVESIKVGTLVPTVRREDLFSIIIPLPGLDAQKVMASQRRALIANEEKRKANFSNEIHLLENEIFEQNAHLRHTLAAPASNLKDSILNIRRIIMEKIAVQIPELLLLKVSDKHNYTLQDYLSISERDADKIVRAVSNQLKVDTGIDEKKLNPIEIISFVEGYSNEYNDRLGKVCTIKFEIDEEVFIEDGQKIKTYIMGNDELLRELFDNLIDNAKKHAFQDQVDNRIEIYIMKSFDFNENDEVQILFSNTGKPFPEDFTINDFVRKGAKSGESKGDGFGGWYINKIIKRLKGNFDIIDETAGEGLPGTDLATSFEINFPIIETEENADV